MAEEVVSAGSNIISRLRAGDQSFTKSLYENYRLEFIHWARDAYNLDKIKAVEIYQEAFTALYYNVREGKLVRLTSSLKTYLFAIGKNILRDHFKREKRFRHGSDEWQVAEQLDHSIMEKYEQSDMKELVDIALKKIGEPCKTVLKLFYFRHFSMEAIAKELNYKTEQIAAKRKHICLKQMRTLVSTIK